MKQEYLYLAFSAIPDSVACYIGFVSMLSVEQLRSDVKWLIESYTTSLEDRSLASRLCAAA